MARATAPVIDTPQTSSSTVARAVGAVQATIESGSTTTTVVARQQAISAPVVSATEATQRIQTVATTVAAQTSTASRTAVVDNRQDPTVVQPSSNAATTTTTTTPAKTAAAAAKATQVDAANTNTGTTTIVNQRLVYVTNNPGNATVGGVQFYANGEFKSDTDFKYDGDSDTLSLNGGLLTANLVATNKTNLGHLSNVTLYGGASGQILQTNGSGGLSWATQFANSNVASFLVGYTGNLAANIANVANLNVTESANLGSINTLTITGGSDGQVLTTTGNGALRWATISANGNVALTSEITNGSSNVIVNADSNVTFGVAGQSEVLTITPAGAQANLFTSNNYTLGNSTTTISTNRWMDAMTATINPTVLFSASNAFSSIDIHVTANSSNSKQISKMLSVTQGTTTHYSQYGNVTVGNELAAFTMDQTSGNVRLIATPETASRVDYRLVITLYN